MYPVFNYYANNGGIVNAAIFMVAVMCVYIGTGKLLQFNSYRKVKLVGCVKSDKLAKEVTYIYDWFYSENSYSLAYYKNHFRERLIEVVPKLEEGLDTMAALIQAAPLLGLFGTVVGMIRTFSLITTFGTANPVVLTEGITISLLTTQAGLLVAFPCMLFHNYITGRKNELVQDILNQGEKMITLVSEEKG
ncbi:MotA/TolQ/ExbB proton channel family protein [Chitinispirillales bacterium ANBcel5]|uniref:MotA/TolQ/ExbB proton channel family protein n=1 Tax=Cellulosispirillum alkaliphilum TaxID=3039283 RepID=UPI002A542F18|nr:MotA/TolQ/ExbB proton channel family protein [Chitinispirillales bacterium ANBcel5]